MTDSHAFDARLVATRPLSPSVRELVFERVDGRPMEFEPGQWLNALLPLTVGEEVGIKRSYSIASAPDGTPRFEIGLTRVKNGPGSTWLCSVEPGSVVPFVGPHGFFRRTALEPSPGLFIATGTGITPVRSMVRAAVAAGSSARMWLVLGVRHEEDIIYRAELEGLAREHEFIRFDVTLSQPDATWEGRRGYVQTHVRELWSELVALRGGTPHAYICGLERMVGSVRDILRKELGLARQQVHSERYD